MPAFRDRIILITGGTSGIGAASARQFAQQGATVYFTGRDHARAEEVIQQCEGRAHFIPCELTEPDQIEVVFAQIDDAHGRLDVLFNNAGSIATGIAPLNRLKTTDYETVMRVNTEAVFLHMKHALTRMSKQKSGVIINNAALLGSVKHNGLLPAYSAAKAAVIALTKSAAIRHAAENIRINAICPGPVHTPLALKAYGSAKSLAEAESHHPRGRFADPDEIAAVVLFLASDASSYINGVDLAVDGGYSLK